MEAFQKIHPLEFYRKFLERSVRPDGRSLTDIRKTTLSVGSITTCSGSSFVKIGNTSVVCGVRAEVGEPPSINQTGIVSNQSKNHSYIFVNVELGPICSNAFSSSKPSEKAMSLATQLNTLINRLDIPTTDFYFDNEGKARWYLYVDIYCLDFDGNITDASIIAMLAALKNVKLQQGIIVEPNQYFKDSEQPIRKLSIQDYFIPLSFSVIDDYILSDPCLEEEKLSSGQITITFNENQEICLLLFSGITGISDDHLKKCIQLTKNRFDFINKLMNEANIIVDTSS